MILRRFVAVFLPSSFVFLVSCGNMQNPDSKLEVFSLSDGQAKLSGNCRDAIDANAQVITLFLSSISDLQRKRNEELARQSKPHCGADLITSYTQADEAPKGTIDLTVTTPASNSQSSFGYPSISSSGSSSSGSGTAGSSFSIVLKASLVFPLGTGTTLVCKNVYDQAAFVDAAIKIANNPVFQNQLNQACAR